MEKENQKQLIIESLKKILKLSYPHCKDGNPNESTFNQINNLTHDILIWIENSDV